MSALPDDLLPVASCWRFGASAWHDAVLDWRGMLGQRLAEDTPVLERRGR